MLDDFLVNGFFLFLFCCFIPLLFVLRNGQMENKKSLLILSSSAAIIACISFPIKVGNGILFDLRLVAQIFGSLYGGPIAALVLALVNILYRSLFDGIGVINTLVVAPIHLIGLLFVRRWFLQRSIKQKVFYSFLIGIFSTIITLAAVRWVSGIGIPIKLALQYALIQSIVLCLIIYVVEVIQKLWNVQNKIFQAQKMETVSQLAASISHEVRNPLTSVKGFMQLLQETALNDNQKNYLDISLSELDKAVKVIEDYLAFANPNPMDGIEALNVEEEIQRITQVLHPLANKSSIRMEVETSTIHIMGNQQYFSQCLVNICKNAIEAMEEHSSGILVIKTIKQKQEAVISISDTGIGMSKEEVSRLGEPYYSTKGKNGTGLGMMFVYNCIKEMGGSIQVESEKGNGTKFVIRLPILYPAKLEKTDQAS
ncbi:MULTISPECIES: HAMP domain-containing sensor histidine kinase [Bacillaceae]|uniref:sensor histidine kinase n=2 Tax=Bacillales TaxID=1385 RepID=UPI001E617DEF|nr:MULTISPECIES: HAMP domain-containing sensor histidine kinase [Bacillaceae]MCE4047355.1 HAMP domain-containing histidine kinase [Bacillus sp. Au-Bac7]MCM3030634.1 HAMP domain-containing histidine kinase [Niallia sp. MER 6]UPO86288.1 HAMP domain-containing histidine kinase [Niallia sp. Man26]